MSSNPHQRILDQSADLAETIAERIRQQYSFNGVIVLPQNGSWRDLITRELRSAMVAESEAESA